MNGHADNKAHVKTSRRTFLSGTAAAAGSAALVGELSLARTAHAAGSDEVKIALVGCGGRGTGAAVQALSNKSMPNVKLVALADAFRDRVDLTLKAIQTRLPEKVDVPEERKFVGPECYQGVMAEKLVDMVLLCTPPGFRPVQFEAAVKAGKHVFMEKPLATDAPGVRRVHAANEEAKRRGLLVAVGHHLRHEDKHREVVKRIHDGAIGELKFLRVYFNSSGVWVRARQAFAAQLGRQPPAPTRSRPTAWAGASGGSVPTTARSSTTTPSSSRTPTA